MRDSIELLVERDGETTRLLSPGVGAFTCAAPSGSLLGAGQDAGVLIVTGRPLYLRVPAGIAGRITSATPERVHQPVGYRTVLYELASVESAAQQAAQDAAESSAGLFLPSPQAGRFYHRPGPDDPAFVAPGEELAEGRSVGLIEVMKTFAHVTYHPGATLPASARVKRYVAGDGAEAEQGEPLLELEP